MQEIITIGVPLGLAVLAFILSLRSFRGKGILLNNAYLYASPQERKTMNPKPYYRQSAIVFGLIGLIFGLKGLEILFHAEWISYLTAALIILTPVYALVSAAIARANK